MKAFLSLLVWLASGFAVACADDLPTIGFIVHPLPATSETTTDYLSVPLAGDRLFDGAVSGVGANTLTVADAIWAAGQFTKAHVRFIFGAEAGRTLDIVGNTESELTLDITDNSAQSTSLDAMDFAVAAGDAFEIVADDTLGGLLNGETCTLVGGPDADAADRVGVWNEALGKFERYYFNVTASHWVMEGDPTLTDYSGLSIHPGASLEITRRAGRAAGRIVLTGFPPTVAPLLKLPGSGEERQYGSLLPIDVTLSEFVLSPEWKRTSNALKADTVSLYDPVRGKWKDFIQRKDNVWLKAGGDADKGGKMILAGSGVIFTKRKAASGDGSFVRIALPY